MGATSDGPARPETVGPPGSPGRPADGGTGGGTDGGTGGGAEGGAETCASPDARVRAADAPHAGGAPDSLGALFRAACVRGQSWDGMRSSPSPRACARPSKGQGRPVRRTNPSCSRWAARRPGWSASPRSARCPDRRSTRASVPGCAGCGRFPRCGTRASSPERPCPPLWMRSSPLRPSPSARPRPKAPWSCWGGRPVPAHRHGRVLRALQRLETRAARLSHPVRTSPGHTAGRRTGPGLEPAARRGHRGRGPLHHAGGTRPYHRTRHPPVAGGRPGLGRPWARRGRGRAPSHAPPRRRPRARCPCRGPGNRGGTRPFRPDRHHRCRTPCAGPLPLTRARPVLPQAAWGSGGECPRAGPASPCGRPRPGVRR